MLPRNEARHIILPFVFVDHPHTMDCCFEVTRVICVQPSSAPKPQCDMSPTTVLHLLVCDDSEA